MIVILYVMDCLRPDFLSCYGYGKETSPHIDGLAREGVLFTHAFSQSTWTRPAGASLLSSTYPSVHGILTHHDELDPAVDLLPVELKRNGFRTAALSSIGNVSPGFGFGEGVDRFIELYREEAVAAKRVKMKLEGEAYQNQFKVDQDAVPIATSEDINEYLFPLLEENKNEDLFVLVWSIDTHNPYFQRDLAKARFSPPSDRIIWYREILTMHKEEEMDDLRSLYEDMIYYNDCHLGCLVEKLKDLDLFEKTLFILMGDHGESFREHGVVSHGGVPYDEQIRIPLIMKFPGRLYRGRVDGLVQQIDVVPTVLDYARISPRNMTIQGKSLMPMVRDHVEINDIVCAEVQVMETLPSYVAVRNKEYKYMAVRRPKVSLRQWLERRGQFWPSPWYIYKPTYLFRLSEDPGEKVNVIDQETRIAESLHAQVKKMLEENGRLAGAFRKRKKQEKPVDEEVAKQLQALGYFD